MSWLALLISIPAVGAAVVVWLTRKSQARAWFASLGFAALQFCVTLAVVLMFDSSRGANFQFYEHTPWLPSIGAEFSVGVDGLGLMSLLLAAVVVPFAIAMIDPKTRRPGTMSAWMLLLQSTLVGNFVSLNFVMWFLFWELALIPAFFLVRGWGGPMRAKAAVRFFMYTMAGSALMLAGMAAVYAAAGTFHLPSLATLIKGVTLSSKITALLGGNGVWASCVFFAVLIGVAVKVPLYPLHGWLPATYSEAAPPVTMILTGVMSKMGVIGMLRVVGPLFPDQIRIHAPILMWIAALGILASAWTALAQRDLRRMLAFSSINHLGWSLLAIFAAWSVTNPGVNGAAALNGAMLQIFNHGITAATLFACLALLERRSTDQGGIDSFGGLRAVMPVFSGLWGIALFASIGLPGLNGFISEFLMVQGSFAFSPWATAVAAVSLLLTAVFLLGFWQKVFHGPLNPRWATMPDLTSTERLVIAPTLVLMVLLGVCPQLLLKWLNPVSEYLLSLTQ
ncbi:MAG: NADH-quinone oxidoreductase subunit M [Verrucomicrobiales bacterium]|nr:NADH-quinone oxidoreductase subunit M [Verrucomicrobiales bacterium]MCP5559259.1 NADH-quinone oxidoreductase subunit M [Verrucomicrobiaceae bacterium]